MQLLSNEISNRRGPSQSRRQAHGRTVVQVRSLSERLRLYGQVVGTSQASLGGRRIRMCRMCVSGGQVCLIQNACGCVQSAFAYAVTGSTTE